MSEVTTNGASNSVYKHKGAKGHGKKKAGENGYRLSSNGGGNGTGNGPPPTTSNAGSVDPGGGSDDTVPNVGGKGNIGRLIDIERLENFKGRIEAVEEEFKTGDVISEGIGAIMKIIPEVRAGTLNQEGIREKLSGIVHKYVDKNNDRLEYVRERIINRKAAIEEAITLLEGVYVHLPQKKNKTAVDPIPKLKKLRFSSTRKNDDGTLQMSDSEFYGKMHDIFVEIGDLHTNFFFPTPYKNKVSFLPFLIEEYYDQNDGGKKKYMVSKVLKGFKMKKKAPLFKKGVIITDWRGVPIDEAITNRAKTIADSNEAARDARVLERMTIRPLRTSKPPEEKWVEITYKEENSQKLHTQKFHWHVATYLQPEGSMVDSKADTEKVKALAAVGLDTETEIARIAKKELFLKGSASNGNQNNGFQGIQKTPSKVMPGIFAYGKYEKNGGETYGYIRIYSFDVDDSDQFLNEFTRIVKDEPQSQPISGLIIDVRGNGGGLIHAAEDLLQLIATWKGGGDIERTLFDFIATPLTLELCEKSKSLERWGWKFANRLEAGYTYSLAFPLKETTKNPKTNNTGNSVYDGPIVLITDALCYSATEIFIAGFKDNKLGTILALHSNTGGGGGNVWSQDTLNFFLGRQLHRAYSEDLNSDWDFSVAIRRAARDGSGPQGMFIEGLGIGNQNPYKMTKDDLLNNNVDLIKEAISILEGM
ncbi:MAG: hypothetical protein GY940_19855 [bacterium]|nr:hypothetical protein [bacterium]